MSNKLSLARTSYKRESESSEYKKHKTNKLVSRENDADVDLIVKLANNKPFRSLNEPPKNY